MIAHKSITILCSSLVLICIYISSCTKSPVTRNTPPVDTTGQSLPKDSSVLNIYIAGDTMIAGLPYGCYWKNGVLAQLPAGSYSYSSSIVVSGNDVYANSAGTTHADSLSYWKNGTNVTVNDTLGFGHRVIAMAVSGNDVYATGVVHEYPALNYGVVYWKNNNFGVHFVPVGNTVHDSWGQAITVDNGDVYIAGNLDNKAVFWKNGNVVHLLADTTFGTHDLSIANSICIDKSNIYIAGILNMSYAGYQPNFQSIAAYWKNNKVVRLTKDTGSIANSIVVSGSDVYVAGAIFGSDGLTRAAYWKNSRLAILNAKYSIAKSIVVRGSDVYIAGNIGYSNAVYWKNEVPVSLGIGQAHSIAISSK